MEQKRFNGQTWERKDHIKLIGDDGKRILMINDHPYMCWMAEDKLSARIAIAQICELGMATPEELSRVFDTTIKSVHNYVRSFGEKGAHGLIRKKRGPRGRWKLNPQAKSRILFIALNEEILEYEEIQKKLAEWGEHISIPSIRQVLLENGIIKDTSVPDPKV